MGDFLEAYARRFDLPGHERHARRARATERGRRVRGRGRGDERFAADQVIVATGAFRHPRVPAVALLAGSRDPPAPLERVPQPVAAPRGSGARRRVSATRAPTSLSRSRRPTGRIVSGKAAGEFPIKVTDTRRSLLGWFIVRLLATRVFTLGTPIGRRMAPHVRHGGAPAPPRPQRATSWPPASSATMRGRPASSTGSRCSQDGQRARRRERHLGDRFPPRLRLVEVPGFVGDDGWPIGARGISPAAPACTSWASRSNGRSRR